VAVDENGGRARAPHRLRGGDEGVCRQDDFITRADGERPHDEMQRIGAAGDADAVPDADISGECFLEFGDRPAENETAARADAGQRTLQLRGEGLVVALQTEERNLGYLWMVATRRRVTGITAAPGVAGGNRTSAAT